eukprot:TRINITY_DN6465_c0_g1_i1.p1 TRINITY_DN6465_c0_g1~~TRINITY_DN6465_c0_g1_i1.p1  ORF type:complete len:676 (+),score=126.09 TRINITY_DN6465_c0_g1_i1:255-2282(+)
MRVPWSLLLFLQVTLMTTTLMTAAADEEFSEELLLRPLPDGKVLAHFLFTNKLPQNHGSHHKLFPKAIYQLVRKFGIREMELSFTQGRWNYGKWGGLDPVSSQNAKPIGVELWALFNVPLDQIDETWRNLTHALSGLFCASINFLESSAAYSSPTWSFYPTGDTSYSSAKNTAHVINSKQQLLSKVRYGALPREAVCTENLTPWLKLLPCRDKAGLAELMDRPSIYKGYYHSQRLYVQSNIDLDKPEKHDTGTILQQTLTLVLQPDSVHNFHVDRLVLHPSWSIGSLFGKELTGQCLLAKSSKVFLELESTGVEKLEAPIKKNENISISGYGHSNFELKLNPDRMIQEKLASGSNDERMDGSILFEYFVNKYNKSHPLNVGMVWKTPALWTPLLPPFSVSRYLVGSGNARGSIVIFMEAYESQKKTLKINNIDAVSIMAGCHVSILVFQIVPWYIRLYFHTLEVFIDGKPKKTADIVKKIQVSPAEDRKSPGMMEMELEIPCGTKSVALVVNFDKGFLRIDEHPPDANQGFDLPSASIIFPNLQAMRSYVDETSVSSMLSGFLHKNRVKLYTEVLLVPLATPDFSMPYNVITLTCTVLALYFGSLLNVLRRRIGEEERHLSDKAKDGGRLRQLVSKFMIKFKGKQHALSSLASRLYKAVLVAFAAVILHYYLTSS